MLKQLFNNAMSYISAAIYEASASSGSVGGELVHRCYMKRLHHFSCSNITCQTKRMHPHSSADFLNVGTSQSSALLIHHVD